MITHTCIHKHKFIYIYNYLPRSDRSLLSDAAPRERPRRQSRYAPTEQIPGGGGECGDVD